MSQSDTQENAVLQDLATFIAAIEGRRRVQTVSNLSLEEVRNRAIYVLTGEVEDGTSEPVDDPTLPDIASIGSKSDRLTKIAEGAVRAIDYILDHPDEFGG